MFGPQTVFRLPTANRNVLFGAKLVSREVSFEGKSQGEHRTLFEFSPTTDACLRFNIAYTEPSLVARTRRAPVFLSDEPRFYSTTLTLSLNSGVVDGHEYVQKSLRSMPWQGERVLATPCSLLDSGDSRRFELIAALTTGIDFFLAGWNMRFESGRQRDGLVFETRKSKFDNIIIDAPETPKLKVVASMVALHNALSDLGR